MDDMISVNSCFGLKSSMHKVSSLLVEGQPIKSFFLDFFVCDSYTEQLDQYSRTGGIKTLPVPHKKLLYKCIVFLFK